MTLSQLQKYRNTPMIYLVLCQQHHNCPRTSEFDGIFKKVPSNIILKVQKLENLIVKIFGSYLAKKKTEIAVFRCDLNKNSIGCHYGSL